jgi:uncharacterized repeat protein (TIGR01451 family)
MRNPRGYTTCGLLLGLGLALLFPLHLLAAEPSAPVATTHSVCPAGPPTCDYATIQAAVDAAGSGDVIKVAASTYTDVQARPAPPGYSGPAVVTQVVYVDRSLTIRGGYTTAFVDPPDPVANATTLDAQGQGRGLFITGIVTARIEGLVITGGDATGLGGSTGGYDGGGGVYVITATAGISNCLIHANTASSTLGGYGGGLYFEASDATLSDNTVQDNTANTASNGYGGGIYLRNTSAMLTANTVQGNTASTAAYGQGGGLDFSGGDVTLSSNTVQGNTASTAGYGAGGGLFLGGCTTTLNGNTVQGNVGSTSDRGNGGGLFLGQGSATFDSNTIAGNTAALIPTTTGKGGGLWVSGTSPFTLTNNLVASNHANTEGSGLWFDGDQWWPTAGRLLHTTIVDNVGSGQGVYVGDYTTLTLTNTIVSNHSSVGVFAIAGGTAALEGTLWYDNAAHTGGEGTILIGSVNVFDDPAYEDPASWDYHLTAGSAAINSGVDSGVTTDIDGHPRPVDTGYDIGADEYYHPALVVTKRAEPDPVQGGERLTYTISVINTGNVDLYAAITDTLPTHTQADGTVFLPGGRIGITWTTSITAPGGAWMETVVVTVAQGYRGPLANLVEVTTEKGAAGRAAAIVNAHRIYLPLILRRH